jgi:hypothetical protein
MPDDGRRPHAELTCAVDVLLIHYLSVIHQSFTTSEEMLTALISAPRRDLTNQARGALVAVRHPDDCLLVIGLFFLYHADRALNPRDGQPLMIHATPARTDGLWRLGSRSRTRRPS